MTVCTEYSIAKQINRSFIMKDKELTLSRRVFILSAGSVTGQKEKNGPLGKLFDSSDIPSNTAVSDLLQLSGP